MSEQNISPPTVLRKGPNEHWEVAPGITCVRLTQGKCALVDTVDYPKISSYRWSTIHNSGLWYASARARVDGRIQNIKMHRLLLRPDRSLFCDHIDGNGLNNSSVFGSTNIRVATQRLNCQNRHNSRSSSLPGVQWSVAAQKWQARITIDGEAIYLGLFTSESEASDMYQKACRDLSLGVFARPSLKSSGFKGVTLYPRAKLKKWRAQARINGTIRHIGFFLSEEEAAAAYGTFMSHSVLSSSAK